MAGERLCVIVYDSDAELDVRAAAPIVAELCRCSATDAALALRRSVGIIARDVPEGEAREAVARLGQAGVAAVCLAQEQNLGLPRAVLARAVQFDPRGLLCAEVYGGTRYEVPWGHVRAIVCGTVERQMGRKTKPPLWPLTARVARAAGSLVGRAAAKPIEELAGKPREIELKETRLLASVAVADGGALHLRLEADRLDYSVLGEKRRVSAVDNFFAVLKAIAQRAPHALSNVPREELVGPRRPRAPQFPDTHAMDLVAEWLLLRALAQER